MDNINTIELRPTKEFSKSLLNAVQSNNLRLFEQLLRKNLNSGLSASESKITKSCLSTILDECCSAPGKPSFVKKLLSVDVDVNHANNNKKKAPIHLAAMNGCEDVLNVLLGYPGIDVNIPDEDGNSALHLSVEFGHLKCSKLLLESTDIQPNLTNKEGITPAHMAASSNKKNDKLVRLFMRCPKVNFDTIVRGSSLTEAMAKNYPQLIPFKYLYSNDESGFISHIQSTKRLEGDDGEYTYLQYACNFGLPKVVRTLLEIGIDPNQTLKTNPKQSIFLASFRGFNSIVRIFLKSKCDRVYYQTATGSVLHEVIKGSNEKHDELNVNNSLCNHSRTLKIFLGEGLEKNLFAINLVDERGNTCLHYAVQIGNADHIHSLLDGGAYIYKKNNLGQTPLDEIGHDILESYLNKCIRTNGVSPSHENYAIICSYKFLCPPKLFNGGDSKTLLESQDSLVENIPETGPLLHIGDNPNLRPLLMHPILTCFLYHKWMKIKVFYYVDVIFYLGFLLFLTSFILETFQNDYSKNEPEYYLRIVVWGFLIALVFRELLLFFSSPIGFLSTSENWLELCLIILTSYLLSEHFFEEFKPALCVIIIQVSFGKLLCILSKHPLLALQWEMFKVVTKNFLNFFKWYSLIIIAFIFCFYVLLKDDEDGNNMFNNIFIVGFKIIIMSTGELDSSSLKTDLVINKLVILLFIFFIPLVLVNLLAGLAVSDTQEIKNDAEIIVILCRIHFIYSIEARVVGDKYMAINKNHTKNVIRNIMLYIIRRFGLKLMLFPDALKNPEITIFPNKNNVVEYDSFEISSDRKKIQRFHIDDDSVNKAKSIIKLNAEDTTDNITEVFFNKCADIENTIKEIKNLLNAIN